jgi:hypothetical protein
MRRKMIVAPMALESQVEEGRREVYDGIELALSASTVLPCVGPFAVSHNGGVEC